MVVVIPTAYQVEAYNLGASVSTVFYPQNNLMKYCKEHNIAYVDALPAFLSPEGTVPLFMDDCHLTDAGHLRMATFVGTMVKTAMAINRSKVVSRSVQ